MDKLDVPKVRDPSKVAATIQRVVLYLQGLIDQGRFTEVVPKPKITSPACLWDVRRQRLPSLHNLSLLSPPSVNQMSSVNQEQLEEAREWYLDTTAVRPSFSNIPVIPCPIISFLYKHMMARG